MFTTRSTTIALAAFGAAFVFAAQTAPQYFVQVVQNGEDCNYVYKTLPMCASKNFVCRMKPGHEAYMEPPSCIEYDPSNMQDNPYEAEENSVNTWEKCDPNAAATRKVGDAPVCKRDFHCMCLHGNGQDCTCVPPDAVDDASGAATCGGNATAGCGDGQYCHYLQDGGMQCGQKPYFS